KYFNERIHLLIDVEKLLKDKGAGNFHICNTSSIDWRKPGDFLKKRIDPKYYFNDLNPIYNAIQIPEKYICSPNLHYPNNKVEINHLFYYKLIGLNNLVRMDFFNYNRNTKKEIEIKKQILQKFNIKDGEKYNVINNRDISKVRVNNLEKYIKNEYKCVDISNLVDFPGVLLKLIEDSEEIHLIESSNVNFIYHCQYKKIMDDTKKVFFHEWCRHRNWLQPNVNLDYSWKMMSTPKLDNWKFIFNEDEI
ncbi:MAG: hypothetical protein H8E98_04415, partial [Bacteroidetes bacterium]|nr:hypothetical protein [Bacteroidota bacterium]